MAKDLREQAMGAAGEERFDARIEALAKAPGHAGVAGSPRPAWSQVAVSLSVAPPRRRSRS
jgi:hypothetical protein